MEIYGKHKIEEVADEKQGIYLPGLTEPSVLTYDVYSCLNSNALSTVTCINDRPAPYPPTHRHLHLTQCQTTRPEEVRDNHRHCFTDIFPQDKIFCTAQGQSPRGAYILHVYHKVFEQVPNVLLGERLFIVHLCVNVAVV